MAMLLVLQRGNVQPFMQAATTIFLKGPRKNRVTAASRSDARHCITQKPIKTVTIHEY